MNSVLHGDNIEILRGMADNSVDSIVTDPPYGIGFMGKAWDDADIRRRAEARMSARAQPPLPSGAERVNPRQARSETAGAYDMSLSGLRHFQVWTEEWAAAVFRVLKPGGHLIAFASPRSYHRMAAGIEDAGFVIRDQIMWVFGSGFPKSLDVGKALDKVSDITTPFVAARQWQGWGTALKPAHEPIVVARKPLIGTVAANVLSHGTGALNIDGCRVATDPDVDDPRLSGAGSWATDKAAKNVYEGGYAGDRIESSPLGRFPANLIHDGSDEVLALFPDSSGSGGSVPNVKVTGYGDGIGSGKADYLGGPRAKHNAGSGSAARFFYCPKASRADRNEGLQGADKKELNWSNGKQNPGSFQSEGTDRSSENHHPTVKPTDLMRYLCRLVTPPGGVVLDPFAGSGSTGKAAVLEGFRFIGIEREADYVAIANARIAAAAVTPMQAGLEFGT